MIYNMPENLTVLFVQIDAYSHVFVFLGFCDTLAWLDGCHGPVHTRSSSDVYLCRSTVVCHASRFTRCASESNSGVSIMSINEQRCTVVQTFKLQASSAHAMIDDRALVTCGASRNGICSPSCSAKFWLLTYCIDIAVHRGLVLTLCAFKVKKKKVQ